MPNFEVWKAVVIFTLILTAGYIETKLLIPVLREWLTEIRKAGHDAEPRPYVKDNHRDPD